MRKINYIGIHCADSDIPDHDNIETIRKWHVEENGWKDIGYNHFIDSNGGDWIGRPIWMIPAAIKNHNNNSIQICLFGRKKFSDKQFDTVAKLCANYMSIFGLTRKDIVAHNELDTSKSCPNFDIHEIIKRLPLESN